jgi:hypothetical protein
MGKAWGCANRRRVQSEFGMLDFILFLIISIVLKSNLGRRRVIYEGGDLPKLSFRTPLATSSAS